MDLGHLRAVRRETHDQFCDENDLNSFLCSAKSGDLPPRPECAPAWRDQLLRQLPAVRLTIVMGRYAMDWHVGQPRQSVTEAVAGWKRHRPGVIPLPHPSPRNRLWLRANPWFERDVLPYLRRRVRQVLR